MAKWNKNDPKGTRWCAELDIHHFYESLRPDVALAHSAIFQTRQLLGNF